MTHVRRPRVGSLFSGVGGLDLGLEAAGFEIAWQAEIDTYCQEVLRRHWPHVRRFGDLRRVRWTRADRVDLLAGGFPCQPVSQAGQKLAEEDERWLWPEFARAIRELQPRVVLVENVPGLRSRGFGTVLGDLAALGYDAEWDGVSAAAVGAPHLRDRVWIVAWRASDGVPDADRDELPIERQRRREQHEEPRAAEPDADGEEGPLADAAGVGRESSGGLEGARGESAALGRSASSDVADAPGVGREDGRRPPRGRAAQQPSGSGALADALDGDDRGVHEGRGEEASSFEGRTPEGTPGQRAPASGPAPDARGEGLEGRRPSGAAVDGGPTESSPDARGDETDEAEPERGPGPHRGGTTDARADADGGGREGERLEEPRRLEGARGGEPDGLGDLRVFDRAPARASDWDVEPDVGRVVDGTASRVDVARNPERLRVLGNGVVPQVVAHVARLVMRRFFS